jgi:hypothetical protein
MDDDTVRIDAADITWTAPTLETTALLFGDVELVLGSDGQCRLTADEIVPVPTAD